MKIHIVDYGMGNIFSVQKKLLEENITVSISSKPQDILQADKIILLGVTTCIQPKTGKAKIELLLEVKNSQDLAKIKHTIIDIPDVVNIERSMNWSKKGWLREE